MEQSELIKVKNLTVKFSDNVILNDVSFSVDHGEVITLVGPSGSGKSTILRCINGLQEEFEGKIWFKNSEVNIKNIKKIRNDVGMIFQNFNLFSHLSVMQNLTFAPTHLKKMSQNEADEHANSWLKKVGLENYGNLMPHRLSGGQKQRVAIARALMMKPQILLCDEPTSALDPENVQEVFSVIKGLAEEGMSLMIVTHEMNFARQVSDRTILLEKGEIVEMGNSNQMFDNASTKRARQFFD